MTFQVEMELGDYQTWFGVLAIFICRPESNTKNLDFLLIVNFCFIRSLLGELRL